MRLPWLTHEAQSCVWHRRIRSDRWSIRSELEVLMGADEASRGAERVARESDGRLVAFAPGDRFETPRSEWARPFALSA